MKNIQRFLTRVLVQQFYLANTGFFLFFFFFFFGIVKDDMLITYHKSLLLSIISSPMFTAIVCFFWMLYNFKCIQFCRTTLKAEDSNYIYILKVLSPGKQFRLYFIVSLLQYLPVLLYSLFAISMAFSKAMHIAALLISLFQLLMILIGAYSIFNSINRNNSNSPLEKTLSVLGSFFNIRLGYFAYLPGYLFNEKKMAFAVVKIFSLLLLSVSFIRNGDDFDSDLFEIFFQVVLTTHAALVFYLVQFSELRLSFSRNLPIPLIKTAGYYLLTYFVLLLPELAFMLVNNHGHLAISHIIFQYGSAIAILFLYTGILYGCGLHMDSYMLFVFTSFVMNFFLQKTGQHFLALLFTFVIAGIVFKSHYYSFEKSIKEEN